TEEAVALRLAEYDAYYRALKQRFLRHLTEDRDSYPYPVARCPLCPWNGRCSEQRERDGHLSLVAWMRREQASKLAEAGLATLARLAIDFLSARRREFPAMHVYHYAAYEETALKRLAQRYATREE